MQDNAYLEGLEETQAKWSEPWLDFLHLFYISDLQSTNISDQV